MAEYIKREMPDMNGKGERKAYYKIKTYSHLRSEDFINKICYPGSGLSRGDVSKVICRMVDEMEGNIQSNRRSWCDLPPREALGK